MVFIIVIHVVACIALIGLVLIQRGRGGGLVESFSGVESMFGTKTSAFLTRTTTILSIVFFMTCLSLAVLSIRQSKSLMTNVKSEAATSQPQESVAGDEAPVPPETPAQPEELVTEAAPEVMPNQESQASVSEPTPVQEGEQPTE